MSQWLSIEHYVPHRGAMLLLDKLLSADEETATAQVIVARDGLFLQDAGMPSWVGLEYIAQTVAAWAGWQALQKQQPVKLGFLLGTRKYEAHTAFFAPGSCLQIKVRCELIGENGLGMFFGEIFLQQQLLACARISVFEPGDGREYLQSLESQ